MAVKKLALKSLAIVAILLFLAWIITNYWSWKNTYNDRIYPGFMVGNLDLSRKTSAEAEELLNNQIKTFTDSGLKFRYGDKTSIIYPSVPSFDSDLAYPALYYDVSETVKSALGSPKERSFGMFLWRNSRPWKKKIISANYSLDEGRIKSLIAENFPELEIAPNGAYFSLSANGQISISQGRAGKGINYDLLIPEMKKNLSELKNPELLIKTKTIYPEAFEQDLSSLLPEVKKIADRGDLVINYQDTLTNGADNKTWKIKPDKLLSWISAKKINNNISVSLDLEKIKAYLVASVAPTIDKAAVLPKFEMRAGKATNWQNGASGQQLDLDASAQKISDNVLANGEAIDLIIKTIASENISAGNDLGITELIGVGRSNFSGSPANRRHNIAIGAAAVHGILIKPGEEFSLIKTLGKIDATTGYLPELVIKGNKTTPEFGGGLCQVGTTVFRAAINSGLPITARQNHSYRVSYYEPAGTDATIYDPWPDFRFINDTSHYILIQARIDKNELYFEFWGQKDGRVITITDPTIYNIVKPEPMKLIETDSLPVGQKKCTEKAHNGADAYFDYRVVYPEGATTTPIQERRFKSHYIPWQEVCLIGVSPSATSTASTSNLIDNQKATGTAPIATSTNN